MVDPDPPGPLESLERVRTEIVPPRDARADVGRRLAALRSTARIGDVESPLEEAWDVGDAMR